MKQKLLTFSLLVLCALLLANVPMVEAYINKKVDFVLYFCNEAVMSVELSITYDVWDSGRTVYAKEVKVTFQYMYRRTKEDATLDHVSLETGRSPWNSPSCVTQHWKKSPWIKSKYGYPPKTFTAQPKVEFGKKSGRKGVYGTTLTGPRIYRVIADGNYMWLMFYIGTGEFQFIQFAWQFNWGNNLDAVILETQFFREYWHIS